MQGSTATISVAAFRADWMKHVPMRDLCDRYSVSRDQVIRLKFVWSLPPRHDRRLRAKTRYVDPTPEEIAEACKRIQSTWSDEVRMQRSGAKVEHVSIKRISLHGEAQAAFDSLPPEEGW